MCNMYEIQFWRNCRFNGKGYYTALDSDGARYTPTERVFEKYRMQLVATPEVFIEHRDGRKYHSFIALNLSQSSFSDF